MVSLDAAQTDIEILQGAYEEAQRIRDLAWHSVQSKMISVAPLSVGDTIMLQDKYSKRYNGKTIRITHMWVHRNVWAGSVEWDVRAQGFPIKKNGEVAVVGEHRIHDVHKAFTKGEFVVLTDSSK